MTRISATLLGAIAAMSWLGPMPIPPSIAAELAGFQEEPRRRRRRAGRTVPEAQPDRAPAPLAPAGAAISAG